MMKSFLCCFLMFLATASFGQSGTYQRKFPGGAICKIALIKKGEKVSCDVFAWWANASARTGNFSGSGTLKGKSWLLKSEDDPYCRVEMAFIGQSIKASFNDCMQSNLPEDFSGNYIKVTANLPGKYIVKAPKAYFYGRANISAKKSSYLVAGDMVEVVLENIDYSAGILISYTSKNGTLTTGYLNWADLKAN